MSEPMDCEDMDVSDGEEMLSQTVDEARFYVTIDGKHPPDRLLQNSLKAWFEQKQNKLEYLSIKSTDNTREFAACIRPSSALNILDYSRTIPLPIEGKEQLVRVTFRKTSEFNPETRQTKSVKTSESLSTEQDMKVCITIDISHYNPKEKKAIFRRLKPYVEDHNTLKAHGSLEMVEHFIEDVKAIAGVEAETEGVYGAAAAGTPNGVQSGAPSYTEQMTGGAIVPLRHFWYATQAYKKEMELIERNHGVKITPEVKLSFIGAQSGEGSIHNKASEDFSKLIQKIAFDFESLPITLPYSNPMLSSILMETQAEEARCVVSLSSKACTMYGLRDHMQKMQEKYGIGHQTPEQYQYFYDAPRSESKNYLKTIGMNFNDPSFIDGLVMDNTHWMLLNNVFSENIAAVQTKFGVLFHANVAHAKATVTAHHANPEYAPSLEYHALRALASLYQGVATSTLSCTLINQSQAREVERTLRELHSLHPFVKTGNERGLWSLIGLPESLGPAVCDLERKLGGPVLKEEDKQRIRCMSRCRGATEGAKAEGENEEEENCAICMDTFVDKKKLKCGHEFCGGCLKRSMASQLGATCPVCKTVFGQVEGDQPPASMSCDKSSMTLPGFPDCGSITIHYNIPSGRQTEKHPSPGQMYHGTSRTAYLPDNKEGNNVLTLLKKAFDQKLIFTVGTSRTNGLDNCVTWNDIHHKTNISGGPSGFGYPDPDYLNRVRDELKAKGIE